MKTLIFIALIFAFVACEKDNDLVQHNIMIRGEQPVAQASNFKMKSATDVHLTPQKIAKQMHSLEGEYEPIETWNEYGISNTGEHGKWTGCGFAKALRDTVNGILIRWSTDILRDDYTLEPSFLMSKNMIFVRYNGPQPEGQNYRDYVDTIAYIPNSVMSEARSLIFQAYRDEDWQTIYNVFNEKFKFIPITGSEYRVLESQGLN